MILTDSHVFWIYNLSLLKYHFNNNIGCRLQVQGLKYASRTFVFATVGCHLGSDKQGEGQNNTLDFTFPANIVIQHVNL